MSINPFLLDKFPTIWESTPFDSIQMSHFKEAFPILIKNEDIAFEEMINQEDAPTFDNYFFYPSFYKAEQQLSRIQSVFFNLNSCETSDEMQEYAKEISPILTEHRLKQLFNKKSFERLKQIYDWLECSNLTTLDKRLVTKVYTAFVDNGALLDDETQNRLKDISKRLSELSLLFMQNNLAAQNHYEYWVKDDIRLEGIPANAILQAKEDAIAHEKPDMWRFTLKMPSKLPVLTYAKDRSLRQAIYEMDAIACNSDEYCTKEYIKEIVNLRREHAQLLGAKNKASFILKNRMAQNQETVEKFLNEFLEKALPFGKDDFEVLKVYAEVLDNLTNFCQWDVNYYREKLKMERYSISDSLLKPYLSLDKCVKGVFEVAEKLFGIQFKQNASIPVYNEDVKAYEVYEADGTFLALFYADFFPRKGKRAGAWMTSYKGQYIDKEGIDNRPHVSIVCNFTKPSSEEPSLLTFNELTTLFHEFGHALHGMMAKGKYEYFSGTSVAWDFVELPSQLMENWCYETECLNLFAHHYQTGELIPQKHITRLLESAHFMSAYDTCRQLGLAKLDMAWHTLESEFDEDICKFEENVLSASKTTDFETRAYISPNFSHVFSGGYAAGYYSYKWAEVLEADAFETFKEEGVFNTHTANRLRKCILSKGSEEDEKKLFIDFKGREPSPLALMKKSGIVK